MRLKTSRSATCTFSTRAARPAKSQSFSRAELEKSYPEPKMFGQMPSQGFFIRHVRNIEMSNVEISSMQADARPAFILDDVQGARFFRVRGAAGRGGAAVCTE